MVQFQQPVDMHSTIINNVTFSYKRNAVHDEGPSEKRHKKHEMVNQFQILSDSTTDDGASDDLNFVFQSEEDTWNLSHLYGESICSDYSEVEFGIIPDNSDSIERTTMKLSLLDVADMNVLDDAVHVPVEKSGNDSVYNYENISKLPVFKVNEQYGTNGSFEVDYVSSTMFQSSASAFLDTSDISGIDATYSITGISEANEQTDSVVIKPSITGVSKTKAEVNEVNANIPNYVILEKNILKKSGINSPIIGILMDNDEWSGDKSPVYIILDEDAVNSYDVTSPDMNKEVSETTANCLGTNISDSDEHNGASAKSLITETLKANRTELKYIIVGEEVLESAAIKSPIIGILKNNYSISEGDIFPLYVIVDGNYVNIASAEDSITTYNETDYIF